MFYNFSCSSPEQLWILNPKRILKKYEVDVKHRASPRDDTLERDFQDLGACCIWQTICIEKIYLALLIRTRKTNGSAVNFKLQVPCLQKLFN